MFLLLPCPVLWGCAVMLYLCMFLSFPANAGCISCFQDHLHPLIDFNYITRHLTPSQFSIFKSFHISFMFKKRRKCSYAQWTRLGKIIAISAKTPQLRSNQSYKQKKQKAYILSKLNYNLLLKTKMNLYLKIKQKKNCILVFYPEKVEKRNPRSIQISFK